MVSSMPRPPGLRERPADPRDHTSRARAELLEQAFGRKKPQPGGCQLERERQTIETPVHGGDGLSILGRELERPFRLRRRRRTGRRADMPASDSADAISEAWRRREWSERVFLLARDA